MSEKNIRHPFKNFFVKKSIQTRIIIQILFVVVLAGLLTTGLLAYVYNAKSQQGSFYYMSNDIMQDLELTSLLGIILPTLITAQLISIIIAFGVGLFSSRKVAVPLYKIEKWASRLKDGKLNTTLAFREEGEMKELTIQCNAVADFYRKALSEIRDFSEDMSRQPCDSPQIRNQIEGIQQVLQRVEL